MSVERKYFATEAQEKPKYEFDVGQKVTTPGGFYVFDLNGRAFKATSAHVIGRRRFKDNAGEWTNEYRLRIEGKNENGGKVVNKRWKYLALELSSV